MTPISILSTKKKNGLQIMSLAFYASETNNSLRSRRLEVVGEKENGRARGRHSRGEGAPARKTPENRFNSHSMSGDISNWSRGSRGKN